MVRRTRRIAAHHCSRPPLARRTPEGDPPLNSRRFRRVIVIVLDSVGIGALPDASTYGDEGSNTLGNIARHVPLSIPTLRALGLSRVASIGASSHDDSEIRAVGRMAEASAGKDSVTGHWEMMGIVLDRP